MHSDLITERDRAETEIDRYPEIDQTDVNVETVLGDKGIADDVYEKSRYAEPYEDGRFAKIKESRKAYYQKQNYSVDYESKTSDTVTVQKRDLLYRLPLITHL